MQRLFFTLIVVLGLSSVGFCESDCKTLLKSLQPSQTDSPPLNLKKAQELAEEFVSRPIASEVLADPGVEMAMEHARELDQLGALPFGQTNTKVQIVAEAIEEALLARGMSTEQAKKASQGWTRAMQKNGVLPD